MKLTIELRIEGDAAMPLTVPIQIIDRACDHVQDVGLTVAEAKAILGQIQQTLVREQLARYLVEHRACPHCGRLRMIKGYHPLRFRTAYGDVPLRSARWFRCRCEKSP